MITLENEHLKIQINKKGAELNHIIDQQSGYEFLWQADPDHWGRHAPVLFPIVGRLKDNQFKYQGHSYEMTQHGFARDLPFEVVDRATDSVTFLLQDSETTRKHYPFAFQLSIQYVLKHNQVEVTYKVVNPSSSEDLYYAIGGHPAFNVSHTEEDEFDQVSVHITPVAEVTHFPLSEDGLIRTADAEKEMIDERTLTHETFKNDALVYEIGEGKTIELKDEAKGVSIKIKPANLPYVGIWSPYPKPAPFVCLEPWAGLADAQDTAGDYTEKIGINHLEPEQEKTHQYTMTFTKK